MDDNAKQASSYQLDQEILDARGIPMTVEEVAGLPTCRYAERVHALRLPADDLAFLKGLRRRIKNRLASQNSRRRSVEHLRRLTRELRAVRVRRGLALTERRALRRERDATRARCLRLREYLCKTLQERFDTTEVPQIDIARVADESQPAMKPKEKKKAPTVQKTETETLTDCMKDPKIDRDDDIFECRLDKLVQQSVNHIYNDSKKVFAKTVFISNEKLESSVKSMVIQANLKEELVKGFSEDQCGVLNLSVKGKRRHHGRKQTSPRRIAYACVDNEDCVLDLKIKKEPQ